jgi:hypothetical protein
VLSVVNWNVELSYNQLIFREIQYTNTFNSVWSANSSYYDIRIEVVQSNQKVNLAVIAGSLGHASSSSYSSIPVIILEPSFTKVIKIYIFCTKDVYCLQLFYLWFIHMLLILQIVCHQIYHYISWKVIYNIM